jgi:signal transduction histidine kinase
MLEEMERLAALHADPKKQPLLDELMRDHPVDIAGPNGIGAVIRTGRGTLTPKVAPLALSEEAASEEHLKLMKKLGVLSCMVIPIQIRGRTLGALSLVTAESSRLYGEPDLAVAEELGRRAGLAIENARLYEQAQRAVMLRDEFLSVASHELKTPVTSLKLQIQNASRKVVPEQQLAPPPEKLAHVFDVSSRQIDRLSSLIDDLLDVTRIGSGKLSYSIERTDLAALALFVLDRERDELTNAGCLVEADCPEAIWVDCDRMRMEQVVVNLLSNAIKYGPGKPIRVAVYRHGSRAVIEVRDHGIGIELAQQERIFDRFERAVSSTKISGLGLGLYIAKQIALGHGGGIRVESRPGEGAKFLVEIPLGAVH